MKGLLQKKTELFSFLILVFVFGIVSFILYTNNQQTRIRSSAAGITPTITPISSQTLPTVTPVTTATIAPVPQHPVYLGMWTQGFWEEATVHVRPDKLTTLENMIGKKVAIAHYYRGWENLEKPTIVDELNTIAENGWRPMVSVNPYFFADCQSGGLTLYKAITSGNCDGFLHTAMRNLKNFGKPLFLRFAWEMNISDIQWSIQKTGSTTEDFIAAWRHFHDIAISEGATNILWVFSPNTEAGGSVAYNLLYPGDTYVDWLGLDGYNWGTTRPSGWLSFGTLFGQSYRDITALAPTKQLMIAEVNSTDQGGDKAAWYHDMLAQQIPYYYPKIAAVVFYNEDRTSEEGVNWLITVTPAALSAFSESIKNPMYLSSF